MTRLRPRLPSALLAAALLCLVAPEPASARTIAERIVAVVGDKPILLSEMRERAKPFLLQVKARVPAGAQQAAAESQVYKELLLKMIDEELIARAAEKANVTVSPQEIEQALASIAAQNRMSLPELFATAQNAGLDEAAYRADLRRQILEQRLLVPYAKAHANFSAADLRARYDRALQEERRSLPYRASSIVLIGDKKLSLAEKIIARARKGEDFSALARQFSEEKKPADKSAKKAGGAAPALTTPGTWARSPVEEDALAKLEPGEVSDVVRIAEKIIILKLEERAPSRYHGFEAAAQEMHNMLVYERADTARTEWLKGLRVGIYIEARL